MVDPAGLGIPDADHAAGVGKAAGRLPEPPLEPAAAAGDVVDPTAPAGGPPAVPAGLPELPQRVRARLVDRQRRVYTGRRHSVGRDRNADELATAAEQAVGD